MKASPRRVASSATDAAVTTVTRLRRLSTLQHGDRGGVCTRLRPSTSTSTSSSTSASTSASPRRLPPCLVSPTAVCVREGSDDGEHEGGGATGAAADDEVGVDPGVNSVAGTSCGLFRLGAKWVCWGLQRRSRRRWNPAGPEPPRTRSRCRCWWRWCWRWRDVSEALCVPPLVLVALPLAWVAWVWAWACACACTSESESGCGTAIECAAGTGREGAGRAGNPAPLRRGGCKGVGMALAPSSANEASRPGVVAVTAAPCVLLLLLLLLPTPP